ncbi:hypothetical protein EJ03DRAFT_197760 [Teratosphaeria nubilosa]|uniref:Uncharacterized protein n=1 Tax=Teratosphaeria nubilosa TaxID=161662 RepID=A0A6G1L024_9PEZI|nr:hypothetical protein EJ03DRAFT_197760 [Teratosphaeria nubilosa]
MRHHSRSLTQLAWYSAGDVPVLSLMWIDRLRMDGSMLQSEAGTSPSWVCCSLAFSQRFCHGRAGRHHYTAWLILSARRHRLTGTACWQGDKRRVSTGRPAGLFLKWQHDGRLWTVYSSPTICLDPGPGGKGWSQPLLRRVLPPQSIALYFPPVSAILRGEPFGPRGLRKSCPEHSTICFGCIVHVFGDADLRA